MEFKRELRKLFLNNGSKYNVVVKEYNNILEQYSLTELQIEALNSMILGKNVFLTGAGGTGKTFILNIFISFYRNILNNKDGALSITSTTGCSASLLNGITLNSWAGIGLGNKLIDYYIDELRKNITKKKNWINTEVLIIDEISMLNPELLEKLEILARKIRKNYSIFGGIQVILSGDFCQLPNVDTEEFCFESIVWDELIDETFYFKEVLRQNDKVFLDILNHIREGYTTTEDQSILNSRLNNKLKKNNYGILPTVLYSKKKNVKDYNEKQLQKLIDNDNKYEEYKSFYEFPKNQQTFYQEFLKIQIDKNESIEDFLRLTIGTQIMITNNYKLEDNTQLFNGKRGVVINFTEKRLPIVRFLDGVDKIIDYYEWKLDLGKDMKISKKQLPIKLAWAITIHKSQGLTLDYVFTDIGESIFEYGQSYVVLSRVKSLESLFIKNIDYSKIKTHKKVLDYYNSIS